MRGQRRMLLTDYPDVLNIQQVSDILGVCAKTTYKLARDKKLEYIKVGRAIRIPKVCLLKYLNQMN
jgi:excisionase family DNA binding protein